MIAQSHIGTTGLTLRLVGASQVKCKNLNNLVQCEERALHQDTSE